MAMRRSNLTRVVAGMVLFAGAMEVPIGASFIAQERVDNPSEQTRRPASSQSSSATQTQTTSIEYKNAQYGFCFSLPESWGGYSILAHRWTGFHNTGGPRGDEKVTSGPVISIRHPRSTSEDPRQDPRSLCCRSKSHPWLVEFDSPGAHANQK